MYCEHPRHHCKEKSLLIVALCMFVSEKWKMLPRCIFLQGNILLINKIIIASIVYDSIALNELFNHPTNHKSY